MEARLIGLYSPAPQSGKSTVAEYLTSEGFKVLPFARILKRMVGLLLKDLGYENHRELVYDQKNFRVPELGVTVRHLLQTLGTEWGRACVHPDVWLRCWEVQASALLADGLSVVVDDVRFTNEAQLVEQLGGEMWLIHRPGAQPGPSHASEGGLDDWNFAQRLDNNGTVLDLHMSIEALFSANLDH